MRLSSWRGILAALAGVTVLSCVDSPMGPRPGSIGGRVANIQAVAAPRVVISQIYGGGGSSTSMLQNDYVELFNAGSAEQDLTGWSVQYASATGTGNFGSSNTQLIALTGSIAAGQYYLVKLAGGTTGGALPIADVTGTISMAAGAGKVALVNQATTLGCNGGSTPCSATQLAHVIDLVGYGTAATTGANFFEGTAAAPTLSVSLAAFRGNDGCTDTNNNSADFTAAAPAPRNSATRRPPCDGGIVIGPLDHIVITGGNSVNVGATITLSAELQDANNQTISDPSAILIWDSGSEDIAQVLSAAENTATISGNSRGSATITVSAASNGVTKTATLDLSVTGGSVIVPSTTFVSEIHYDNSGTDTGEKIEIEGDANTSLDGWTLLLYNGSPGSSSLGVYNTIPLSGVIPESCGARGVVVVSFDVNGIQNGAADGWALVNAEGRITELKSYEGTFTATDGPAEGLLSTAIDADQSSVRSPGRSVQRAGNGVWFGPRLNTFGTCNQPLPPPQQSIAVTSGKEDLALAMQTQFFYGDTDAAGQPVTSVVWSTSNPAIITVDQRGIVTAKGLGSAQLIATASDGRTGAVDMIVYLAAGSTGIRLGHNTEFGEPADSDPADDFLIRRPQYTVSYNPQRGGANWVSWNLSESHIGDNGRCPGTCYSADTALSNAGLPAYTTADWVSNSPPGVIGYDRGHMAPSADWTSSEADNNTTFFLTNFLPQRADLNQGPWERLESALRDSVSAGREVYVIAGGIFTNGVGLGTLLNLGKIGIPDSTWKIAVITSERLGLQSDGTLPPNTTVLAVNMPNVQGIKEVHWTTYATTVAKIERSTGYDFLKLLAESVECRVEGRNCAPAVGVFAGGTILRGETYTATGTIDDPDADSWTGLVNYGDGSGTSAIALTSKSFTLSHVYATAGSFTVVVSVNDGTSTATRSASVTVKTAAQGIRDLNAAVAGLTLDAGQKNSLQVKLGTAAAQLEEGNATAAVKMLRAFIAEMNAGIQSGRITSGGSPIVAYAQRVIASIIAP